jgi:hypothetical protein
MEITETNCKSGVISLVMIGKNVFANNGRRLKWVQRIVSISLVNKSDKLDDYFDYAVHERIISREQIPLCEIVRQKQNFQVSLRLLHLNKFISNGEIIISHELM